MTKLKQLIGSLLLVPLLFATTLVSAPKAHAADPVLGVTQITSIQSFAEDDGTFENGWKWIFDVTVPDNEPILKMKFADWVSGLNTILAANNIRFSSEQSIGSSSTTPIVISAANVYSSEMILSSTDLDVQKAGRQIQILVEARVPEGSAGGSYSTSYAIQTLADTTAPVVTRIGLSPVFVEINTPYVDAGATAHDNVNGDLTASIVTNGLPVDTSVLGTTTITYDVTDSHGNAAVQVTRDVGVVPVEDHTPPTITAPADITAEATGEFTVVNLGIPTVFDNVDPDPDYSHDPEGPFPLGTTTVTWTATDSSGNMATDTQDVGIVDTTKPVITLNGDNPLELPVFDEYVEDGATALDNYDSALLISITGTVDSDTVGSYEVHYNVTDSNGNVADEVIRTVNVVPRPITVTAFDQSKVFGDPDPILDYEIISGSLHLGDDFTGDIVRAPGEDIGEYPITQGTLALNSNYDITFTPATFTITGIHAEVHLSDLDQTYDGSPKPVTVTTDPAGLDVDVTYDGSLVAPTDVGSSYLVTATVTEPNYEGMATGTLVISPVELTVTATGEDKVYDGNTHADVTFNVTGELGVDSFEATGTAAFNNKNVGTDKPVSVTGITLIGANSGNYTFNTTANTDADITPRTLTVTADGHDKVYDGNTTAHQVTLDTDAIEGDDVVPHGVGFFFIDSFVGTDKDIKVEGIYITGADIGNYSLASTTADGFADITPKALTITGISIEDKEVDGNTDATITGSASLVGVVSGNDVTLGGSPTASFDTPLVGTDKPVTVTGYTIGGASAGNYTLTQPTGLTADITDGDEPEPITLDSIEITNPANKTSFEVGEGLDITGLEVTGHYSDASEAVLPVTLGDISGFDSSVPDASQTLTITLDGKTTTYDVEIVALSLSSEKAILTFDLNDLDPDVSGVVNEGDHTITVTVPNGTDVTDLTPTITVSADATVSPLSGAAQDFTDPVNYTVTAEDGTTQVYTVTVTEEAAPVAHTITASAGANGSITPSGDVLVDEGDDKEFTITPNEGYVIDEVIADSVSQGSIPTYTFNDISTDHTISATFKLPTLTAPTVEAPSEEELTVTEGLAGTLQWTDVSEADTYDYQVSAISSNVDLGGSLTDSPFLVTGLTASELDVNTAPQGTYYWQARAVDIEGNPGPWSEVYTLTINPAVPVTPVTVAPTADEPTPDGASFVFETLPKINWTDVDNATSYDYQIGDISTVQPDNSFGTVYRTVHVTDSEVTGAEESPVGVYYWHARGLDALGNPGPWSAVYTLTITAP